MMMKSSNASVIDELKLASVESRSGACAATRAVIDIFHVRAGRSSYNRVRTRKASSFLHTPSNTHRFP